MSWLTDEDPIQYLERRVRYLKKKFKKVEKTVDDPHILPQLPIEDKRYMIARRLMKIKAYIEMYQEAVKNLRTIEDIQDKVDNQESFKK